MGKPATWGQGGRRALCTAVAALAISVHGPAAADEDVDARLDQLRGHLKSCTREFGYDPDRARSLGANELGAGEAKWRDCAYQGIREIMVPASAVPEAYDTLIALDRVMTRDIEAGKRTRDERRKRIQGMVDDILAKEKAGGAEKRTVTEQDMEREREDFDRRRRELQRMRRIESMMR